MSFLLQFGSMFCSSMLFFISMAGIYTPVTLILSTLVACANAIIVLYAAVELSASYSGRQHAVHVSNQILTNRASDMTNFLIFLSVCCIAAPASTLTWLNYFIRGYMLTLA